MKEQGDMFSVLFGEEDHYDYKDFVKLAESHPDVPFFINSEVDCQLELYAMENGIVIIKNKETVEIDRQY
jgi:hypothetical protein